MPVVECDESEGVCERPSGMGAEATGDELMRVEECAGEEHALSPCDC